MWILRLIVWWKYRSKWNPRVIHTLQFWGDLIHRSQVSYHQRLAKPLLFHVLASLDACSAKPLSQKAKLKLSLVQQSYTHPFKFVVLMFFNFFKIWFHDFRDKPSFAASPIFIATSLFLMISVSSNFLVKILHSPISFSRDIPVYKQQNFTKKRSIRNRRS